MNVTIVAVNQAQAPKGYKVAEVKYLRDGKEETRKLMSFADETVFAQAVGLTAFPVEANVVLKKELNKKDGKEYWNWKAIETQAKPLGGSTDGNKVTSNTGKVLGSNYETPAERARRQIYITRSASINAAIAFYASRNPKGSEVGVQDVLSVARQFEQHVLDLNEQVADNDKQPTDRTPQ